MAAAFARFVALAHLLSLVPFFYFAFVDFKGGRDAWRQVAGVLGGAPAPGKALASYSEKNAYLWLSLVGFLAVSLKDLLILFSGSVVEIRALIKFELCWLTALAAVPLWMVFVRDFPQYFLAYPILAGFWFLLFLFALPAEPVVFPAESKKGK